MSPIVHIHDVEYKLPGEHLHGARVDLPVPGGVSDAYGFDLRGWILGRSAPVKSVDALVDERQVASIPVTEQRADIAAAHPDVANASTSGFAGAIAALRLRPSFEVTLRATFVNGGRLPFASIRGRRARLPQSEGAALQPLMLTYTIGRTGSTWLAWLLGCHPEIVSYSPFAHDARIATYWVQVLQDLSGPDSYRQQLDPQDLGRSYWWLGQTSATSAHQDGPFEAQTEASLGRRSVEAMARFCETQISLFYANLGGDGGRPRYFAEKVLPYEGVPDLLTEVYGDPREVILVRDFRDVLSSILAFNRKRGYEAFGRETVRSDAEYVTDRMLPQARALLQRMRARGTDAHLVRYEDLVLQPRATLAQLLRHVGVDSSDETVMATLDRAYRETAHMSGHRTTNNQGASIGRWRSDLSPQLAELSERAFGPILTEFGYHRTVDPAGQPA
jgi:Sulfotransferase family